MKIGIFTPSFPRLSETFVINQITGLLDLGIDVEILTNEKLASEVMHNSVENYNLESRLNILGFGSDSNYIKKTFITIYNIAVLCVKLKFKSIFNVISNRLLSRNDKVNVFSAMVKWNKKTLKYDKIICHFGTNGYYLCYLRELGIIAGDIAVIFHGAEMSKLDIVNRYKNSYRRLFDLGEIMLPISKLWADRLISWGCDPRKIIIHHMGVNISDFPFFPRNINKELNVIQVGRLTYKKSIIDSIHAVYEAHKSINITFTIIGTGELYLDAKNLIEKLGAESYINLVGQQPQDVVKEYLSLSNVFLLPSCTSGDGDMEGIPVALMEAMASGLLVLSTFHSGIPELITNNESGYLVKEHDIQALTNRLVYISRMESDEIYMIQKNARMVCENYFDNHTLNSNLIKI